MKRNCVHWGHALRTLLLGTLAVLSACGGDDPIAPQEVVGRAYDLAAVEGASVPAQVRSTVNGQHCDESFRSGVLAFTDGEFTLVLGSELACSSGTADREERVQGTYVQNGEELDLNPDFVHISEIVGASISGDRVFLIIRRTGESSLELEFKPLM